MALKGLLHQLNAADHGATSEPLFLPAQGSFPLGQEAGVRQFAVAVFRDEKVAARRLDRWAAPACARAPAVPPASRTCSHPCHAARSARKEVLGGGKLFAVQEDAAQHGLTASCSGSGDQVYSISIQLRSLQAIDDWAEVKCSCPAASKETLCKHGLALLLWRLERRPGQCEQGGAGYFEACTAVRPLAASAVGRSPAAQVPQAQPERSQEPLVLHLLCSERRIAAQQRRWHARQRWCPAAAACRCWRTSFVPANCWRGQPAGSSGRACCGCAASGLPQAASLHAEAGVSCAKAVWRAGTRPPCSRLEARLLQESLTLAPARWGATVPMQLVLLQAAGGQQSRRSGRGSGGRRSQAGGWGGQAQGRCCAR